MITLFSRIFIKNHHDFKNPDVRRAYGILCGAVGIALNILLFGMKLFAGLTGASIAIIADAFNNLSDAASSMVALLGFKLAGQKPDADHPYGHGRLEYISGLAVAFLILLMAFELFRSSVSKILHPEPTVYSPVILLILILSILIKCYMALYNHRVGQKIDSVTMKAVSKDSLNDCIATSAVLLSLLLAHFTGFIADGYCGIFVSVIILISGIQAAKDTASPLLGQAPDPGFVSDVKEIVLSYEGILGIHDLEVHSYGPDNTHISLHAEVPADRSILETHNLIDSIEHRLKENLGCRAVIHMDPVVVGDPETAAFEYTVKRRLAEIDPALSVHDLRIIKDTSDTKLKFDVAAPFDFALSDNALTEILSYKIRSEFPEYTVIITVDRV